MAAMVGGGTKIARPGAISRSHRGILLLDEAPQFDARILDALRTPLESGEITIVRSFGEATYPARFQMVMTANPCPCGMRDSRQGICRCSPMAIRRYRQRLSGPLLDRVDIHQLVLPSTEKLSDLQASETSETMRGRVEEARKRQRYRFRDLPWQTNGEVSGAHLRTISTSVDTRYLDEAVCRGMFSYRAVDKVMRLAWTICDLAAHSQPTKDDLFAAMSLRRQGWGE